MTPLELGLLGAGVLLFGVPSSTVGVAPRWGGAIGLALGGSFLALGAGNLFLLQWWGSTAALPHGSGVIGFFPAGGSPEYLHHYAGWTHPGGDLKFVLLFLFSLAGVAFLRRGGTSAEPLLLGLLSVVAGLITFSVDNLILLYLGLELQALCLYTLVGFFKFQEERTDSAVRYLLSGSLVSGFMLLGFARLYGGAGTFHLSELTTWDSIGSAWVVGVVLFKVGAAPFHFWAPVVYTPLEWGTLALTTGAAKVNLWYLLVGPLAGSPAWWPTWWAGVISVGVGSIGGFFQTSLGGVLAYSGVINGGYLLLLSTAVSPGGYFFYGYYLVVYLVGTAVLVGVLSVWGDTRFETQFSAWGKLGVGFPLVVYYLTLNLGGLPVFPGFFAKLALLSGLAGFGFFLLWGVVAASVVPAVYYVSVGVGALFKPTSAEVVPPGWVHPVVVATLVVGLNGLLNFVALTVGM